MRMKSVRYIRLLRMESKARMDTNLRNRRYYIDFLRAIAAIAVVFYHCSTGGDEQLGVFVRIILSWCVPAFLMITGALFLDGDKELTERSIFLKTIPKMIGILAVWGWIYNLFSLFVIDGLTLASVLKAAIMVVRADTTYCYQFWYLYFIVGMYVLLPLIKPWVARNMEGDNPNTETKLVFGFILLVGIIVPSIRDILGISDTYWKGAFKAFSGLAFYLLCGCWLSKWLLPKYIRVSLFVTWMGQLIWLMINVANGNAENVSSWYGYESFFTWEMSILLFDSVRRIDFARCNRIVMRIIQELALDSLGIYIFHVMIIWVMTKIPFMNNWSIPLINMVAVVLVTVSICIIGTRIVRKIPVLKELI